jgi:DNA-binding transcriptional MerR regulator
MKKNKVSIGEVSKIVDLPQSVLRYWESVFEQLSPEKTIGGTRKYSDKDIETILRIKDFLYDKKYTIKGAKSALMQDEKIVHSTGEKSIYHFIKEEIDTILKELEDT